MSADGLEPERTFVAALQRMFGRPDYLLPVVAAQKQYREVHYGLTAAALLEDVFTDAVSFYVRQFEPEHAFERAERGAAEVDYSWDSSPISHKSGLGPTDISVLWDATVEHHDRWSSHLPIAYLSTGYAPTNGVAIGEGGAKFEVTSMFRKNGFPTPRETQEGSKSDPGHAVIVVRWNLNGSAEVLHCETIKASHANPGDVIDFSVVWNSVTREASAGRPANFIEVLRTKNAATKETIALLKPGSPLHISFDLRAGFYLLPTELLTDVPLGKNNRGQLLKKDVVTVLMQSAAKLGMFVPMPLWYTHYAAPRPPDTFLALRSEFDSRFSSARTAH